MKLLLLERKWKNTESTTTTTAFTELVQYVVMFPQTEAISPTICFIFLWLQTVKMFPVIPVSEVIKWILDNDSEVYIDGEVFEKDPRQFPLF